MKIIKGRNRALLIFISLSFSALATVRLPKLISDGMILQRDCNVKVWGWADPNEKITIEIAGKKLACQANEKGEWVALLSPQRAGGPFSMEITGTNSIKINDILFGDVWLCSGQSNMELPMFRVKPRYEDLIKNSENANIRCFTVPQKYNFKSEQSDFDNGIWKAANPINVLKFSAVAYFFARELYDKYKVPVGLINASLGGSPIEAWMSEDALKAFPNQLNEAIKFRNDDLIKQIEKSDNERIGAWYAESVKKDAGYKNPTNHWSNFDLNTADWGTMNIPGYWDNTELGAINGVVWFRKEIQLPATMAEKPAKLNLGRIVDADSVFINGSFIGTTSYQYPPRWYTVPANVLKEGNNTIVVRVISNSGKGGFVLDKPYTLTVGNTTIDLKGAWHYKLGATMPPLGSQTFVRWKPMGLYNAMIAPLRNYNIKGVVWYQGESNTGNSAEYAQLFPAMILDWRMQFKQGVFPFLFVQLPNFMEPNPNPAPSSWAMLRESQLKTLSVPKTGMAVAIDLGEWNDVHPLDKLDVGKRLVLSAQKLAYNDKSVVYSGPVYKSMKIVGSKIELTFNHTGSGLIAKNGQHLHYFSIAGADKKFVWAKAEIVNNQVIVWSDSVKNPVAIRYAWADNPENANLYNNENLPASPFRTDSW